MITYKGMVSGFMPRTESPVIRKRTTLVWDFRIERPGQRRVAVEMRGKYYRGGSVNNGDIVELSGRLGRNGIVRTACVSNLTAGTTVRAHKYNASTAIIGSVKALVTVAFLVAAVAAFLIFRHHTGY
jgi:hypothetical protein